jgi:hypothetical protein
MSRRKRGESTHCSQMALALAVVLALALTPASALAAPPVISNTGFFGVGETSVTFEASVDPSNANVEARFDYTTLAGFQAEGFQGAPSVPAGAIAVPSKVKGKGDLKATSATITGVLAEAGAFGPGQAISGEGIPTGARITKVEEESGGALVLLISKPVTETKTGVTLTAIGSQPVSAHVEGLAANTVYVFRAAARKSAGADREEAQGPAVSFSTLGPPPTFGPCPNDAFRIGQYAPPGDPSALLPDCRSFELASPTAKNGNEVRSYPGFARAGTDGTITFGTAFSLPGGVGAQNFPFYLATRSPDGSGWSTSGVLPPGESGEEASMLVGQLPDLSATYATATHLGKPSHSAFFELHPDGAPPTQLTPYVVPGDQPNQTFGFAGASAGAGTLVIESRQALPEEEGGATIEGSAAEAHNVYAWDRATAKLSLAGRMNSIAATEALLPEGAFAGPYNWVSIPKDEGGAIGHYYLEEEHAVTSDGSVFFTSVSSGKLYERLHPTEPQSAVVHEGEPGEECTEAEKACTIEISASYRSEPDPAGEEPAAFQMAAADGSQVLFTSPEKLTDDANTGPEQPKAAIGRATLHGEEPADGEEDEFVPTTHALGVAVDPKGEYLYWVDPSIETIARAKLDAEGNVVPNSKEPRFIEPGNTLAEDHPNREPGVLHSAPSRLRYVTVGPCPGGGECIYWTNTGPPGERQRNEEEVNAVIGGGSIGRAELDSEGNLVTASIDPEFIAGSGETSPGVFDRRVADPQGIAVNSEHIYWANSAHGGDNFVSIGRASLDGTDVRGGFFRDNSLAELPSGLALDGTHLYFAVKNYDPIRNGVASSVIYRVLLTAQPESDPRVESFDPERPGWSDISVGEGSPGDNSPHSVQMQDLAVRGPYVYWLDDDSGIGRIGADKFTEEKGHTCLFTDSPSECEYEFLKPRGTLFGLAADPSGSHLFWSSNGETPKNPGNDLYRFTPGPGGGALEDLTIDPTAPNGAEVQGVLGTSDDGSYIYLAANADLDGSGPAHVGDCAGRFPNARGECSIYLLHGAHFEFVGRVNVSGEGIGGDIPDWLSQASPDNGAMKLSLVSPDGRTLIFKSSLKLTAYDNHGEGEMYRYRVGEGLICLTCLPSGEEPSSAPSFGSGGFTFLNPGTALGAYRIGFASTNGDRLFFETTDALVPSDTDGLAGCPPDPGFFTAVPSCLDLYEWEAPGAGTCTEGGPGYAPLDHGCIYLISPGTKGPSIFLDASPSGKDLYFLTRSRLVGADTDELTDVYDARVAGGIAGQNQPPPPPPCEGEGCVPAATAPPTFQAPPKFSGPPNPKPRRCKAKRCKKKHAKGKKHHGRHHHRAKHRAGGGK